MNFKNGRRNCLTFKDLPLAKAIYRLDLEVQAGRIVAPGARKTLRNDCDISREWFDWLEENVRRTWKQNESAHTADVFLWDSFTIYNFTQRMRKNPSSGTSRAALVAIKKGDSMCRRCGTKDPDAEVHTDHIVPRALGGTDEVENYQITCMNCNTSKGHKRCFQSKKKKEGLFE